MAKRAHEGEPVETGMYQVQVKDEEGELTPVWLFWNAISGELCRDREGNMPVRGAISVTNSNEDGVTEITLFEGRHRGTYIVADNSSPVEERPAEGNGKSSEYQPKVRQDKEKPKSRRERAQRPSHEQHSWNRAR